MLGYPIIILTGYSALGYVQDSSVVSVMLKEVSHSQRCFCSYIL